MTFAEDLKQLALSMDGIYEGQLTRISRIVQTYTQKTLNIQTTKVFVSTLVDGKIALERRNLGSLNAEITESVRDSQSDYRGQVFMAYDREKPLWIVSKEGQRNLRDVDNYSDLWSGVRNIPKFRPRKGSFEAAENPIKTSISIPLKKRRDGRVFGIINFRTSDYIEATQEAMNELSLLADTMSFLLGLYEARKISGYHSDMAIEVIENRLNDSMPRLTKPMVFVASSKRADQEVVSCILLNLEKFSSQIEYVHWERIEAPGNIISQLLDVIGRSRYGICYFSEKNENDQFFDNSNVIFEAGMFHGRIGIDSSTFSPWIAIREEKSPEIFFDIAQERILLVNRNQNGSLRKRAFETALNRRIEAMINQQEI